jgi:hypothetical protein
VRPVFGAGATVKIIPAEKYAIVQALLDQAAACNSYGVSLINGFSLEFSIAEKRRITALAYQVFANADRIQSIALDLRAMFAKELF